MILAISKQLFNLYDELDGLNRRLYDHIYASGNPCDALHVFRKCDYWVILSLSFNKGKLLK